MCVRVCIQKSINYALSLAANASIDVQENLFGNALSNNDFALLITKNPPRPIFLADESFLLQTCC